MYHKAGKYSGITQAFHNSYNPTITCYLLKNTCHGILLSFQDIKDLEEFRAKNQRLEKLWVGRLLLYSSVLYLITCISVYFCYLPEQWTGRIVMTLPLFIFPIL